MQIQEYQLKVGVICHEQVSINDLLEYLHIEINQYLTLEVKKIAMGSKSNQKFVAAFQKIIQTDIEQQEYVGFIFIYNNTKFDSLEHVKRELQGLDLKGSEQTFLVLAELQGKALNIAMDQGTLLAEKYQGKFIKLSYQNSEEIVSIIRSYIHTMIQNYYFPQQIIDEQDDVSSDNNKQYELNYVSKNVELTEQQQNKINQILEDEPDDEPYLLRVSKKNANTKQQLEQAQKEIDGNIKNLQKVLNNMDLHIKSRVDNEWFRDLKKTIYSKVQKQSTKFSRIKLTQHFLDQGNEIVKYKTPLQTILLKKRKNLLMNLKFNIGDGKSIELQVFEDSNYPQLAKQALRKIGLKWTEKNQYNIQSKIQTVIRKFILQLNSAITNIHKQRINRRKFLIK